jgi:hypothetical protein
MAQPPADWDALVKTAEQMPPEVAGAIEESDEQMR